MSQIYHLTEGSFESMMPRMIMRSVIFAAISVGAGIFISDRNNGPMPSDQLMFFLPLIFAIVGYSLFSSIRRERAAWQSYEIILSETSITRRMSGRPDITLTSSAITHIIEAPNYAITVRGPSPHQTILIPHQLDGLSELRAILSSWHPISSQPPRSSFVYSLLALLLTCMLMVMAFSSTTPYVAVPASLLLAGGLAWCAWYIHHSPHTDVRLRRMWWIVLLPALSALLRAYFLLYP